MCSRFQCTQWDFKYGQGYGEVCSRTLQATEALRFYGTVSLTGESAG